MVTSELRRVRYPFAGRAAAPRVVEPLFLYTPVRCRGFCVWGAAYRTYDLSWFCAYGSAEVRSADDPLRPLAART
jgi:hypothetical protein